MDRAEILAMAVHSAWCAVSISIGETPVLWAVAPEWRRNALHHTIGFWESWNQYEELDERTFCAATQLMWTQYHKRNKWTHSELIPYASLNVLQKAKLPAMLRQYIFTRSLLDGQKIAPPGPTGG
jgi:hypothetical protein